MISAEWFADRIPAISGILRQRSQYNLPLSNFDIQYNICLNQMFIYLLKHLFRLVQAVCVISQTLYIIVFLYKNNTRIWLLHTATHSISEKMFFFIIYRNV